MKVVCQ